MPGGGAEVHRRGVCGGDLFRRAAAWAGRLLLVVGDLIADRYIYGEAVRISREAPVLILRQERERLVPGGAANAARNVQSLGGRAVLVGAVGGDAVGQGLLAALAEEGIQTGEVAVCPTWETWSKTRILGGGRQAIRQQLVRLDRGPAGPLPAEAEELLARRVRELVPRAEGVIVSDYGCGTVTPRLREAVLEAAARAGIFVGVDSRYSLLAFGGASAATPNEPEAEEALGKALRTEEELLQGGRELLQRLGCRTLLITRGERGMFLFTEEGGVYDLPAYQPETVFDVTGAGDTVMACFALGLSSGVPPLEAALLANLAAGLAVRRPGAAAVTGEELQAALAAWQPVYRCLEEEKGEQAAARRRAG
ncbi:MAG: PfkB family carbohydrate kinase [Bacillota bacterium]|nr:PfkB family carbohydrate kinase [Bacillota bacterium]